MAKDREFLLYHLDTGEDPACLRRGTLMMLAAHEVREIKPDFITFRCGMCGRDCKMQDVSDSGARLTVLGSIEGLVLKEFFLLLSSTGLAYRRCELSWVNGDQLGASFVRQKTKHGKQSTNDADN